MEEASLLDLLRDKEEEIVRLKNDLKHMNENLSKAGELGSGLLEQNSHLEEMLETIQRDHANVVEDYEQEKYSLENKLELLNKMKTQVEANLNEETQRWRTEVSQIEAKLAKKHRDEMSVVKKQHDELNVQLQQERRTSSQRLDTLALKDSQIQKLQRELHQMRASLNDTLSGEVAELTNENLELKMKLNEMEASERGLSHVVDQLKDMLETAKLNEENLRQDKEDIEKEASTYCSSLENCREECRELQVQLDLLKLQPNDPNSRGNSLFAEVEDRRVKAEKELVRMKSHYKCLQSQNEQLKHYTLKLKMQISSLLETRSRTADQHHVQSLEESLSIVRNDNSKLLQRLSVLQEKVKKVKGQYLPEDVYAGGHSAVVQFLKNELKEKSTEVERLTEELRLHEMYLMTEAKKVSSLERDLYDQTRQLDAANSAKFKLQIEIDRLKLKCGEDVKVRTYQHKWKSEKITRLRSVKESGIECPKDPEKDKENTEHGKESLPHKDVQAEKHVAPELETLAESNHPGEREIRQPLTEKESSRCTFESEDLRRKSAETDQRLKKVSLHKQTQSGKRGDDSAVKHVPIDEHSVSATRMTTAGDCKQQ